MVGLVFSEQFEEQALIGRALKPGKRGPKRERGGILKYGVPKTPERAPVTEDERRERTMKTNAKLTRTTLILMSCIDMILLYVSLTAYDIIVRVFNLKKVALYEDLLIIGSIIAGAIIGLLVVYKAGLIENESYTLTDLRNGLIRWKGEKQKWRKPQSAACDRRLETREKT